MSIDSLLKLLEQKRKEEAARKAAAAVAVEDSSTATESTAKIAVMDALAKLSAPEPANSAAIATAPNVIEWNAEQRAAIESAMDGKAFCLIGAAGTGKTTTVKQVMRETLDRNVRRIANTTSNVLKNGLPGIVLVSFTNRAVRNLAKALAELPQLRPHCVTIHKLLEYGPEYYEEFNEDTESYKTKMRFVPGRTKLNPLTEVEICIVDEASMVDVTLFKKLQDALPNAVFIFLGDLNQLQPVFGDPILGFKLAELPVIELTRVYRQAMTSPIIAFQHNYTLKGFMPSDKDLEVISAKAEGLTFVPVTKNPAMATRDKDEREHLNERMVAGFGKYFEAAFLQGKYTPGEDIILMPFNKSFGCDEMNRHIAQFISRMKGAEVHEILAGREKHYYAIGDHIVYDKREWHIQKIERNPKYIGDVPLPASTKLDRWGVMHGSVSLAAQLEEATTGKLERILDVMDLNIADAEEVERAASHLVTLVNLEDSNLVEILSTSGEINATEFGYAISVHKSQGSEWRKVYLFMLEQHRIMFSRELLYTGMTRAKEELVVFFSPNKTLGKKESSIAKCIQRQQIPGKTWRDKMPHFQGKWETYRKIMDDGNIFKTSATQQQTLPIEDC